MAFIGADAFTNLNNRGRTGCLNDASREALLSGHRAVRRFAGEQIRRRLALRRRRLAGIIDHVAVAIAEARAARRDKAADRVAAALVHHFAGTVRKTTGNVTDADGVDAQKRTIELNFATAFINDLAGLGNTVAIGVETTRAGTAAKRSVAEVNALTL